MLTMLKVTPYKKRGPRLTYMIFKSICAVASMLIASIQLVMKLDTQGPFPFAGEHADRMLFWGRYSLFYRFSGRETMSIGFSGRFGKGLCY